MSSKLINLMRENAIELPPIDDPAFGQAFDHLGDYKVVMIGDGSHGTSEFYHARCEITKFLVEKHGFNVVAVEADWPDAEDIDRYVRQRPGPKAPIKSMKEPAFQRFPTWMWRNEEVRDFVHWLRDFNARLDMPERTGFYGLDLYSLGRSLNEVIRYLDRLDPRMAALARERYATLMPWVEEPQQYGLAASYYDSDLAQVEHDVVKMLVDLLEKRLEYASRKDDGEEFHSAEQNANIVADAERYYRSMYSIAEDSWNLRDTHMFQTLERLLLAKGGMISKAVVWAHNSHIGDARYTSMGRGRDELNIGQLAREALGRDRVALIGCGTHTGTVAAAHDWGDDMQVMSVNPSRNDSWEYLAHKTGLSSFYLPLRPKEGDKALLSEVEEESPRLERFIGVIYRPLTERQSHYSKAWLKDQLDGYIWFEETRAVHLLEPGERIQPKTALGVDETYPFAL
ncbi:hypothetical protein KEM54_003341 [Ascosphaera aggregata]|nr:hypothetical protein KEM54_003341 [Ascosphaera aggregata]